MLLTVFGAGASHDSVPELSVNRSPKWRPPLASELFDERFAGMLSSFKRCEPIAPVLATPGASIEQLLQEYMDEAPHYPERYRQLMAVRYYLQYMIWECETQWELETRGTSCYATLLDQMNRWTPQDDPIQLVTFNYDRLLESALKAFGLMVSSFAEYTSHERFHIAKLHGSVDWGRELDLPIDEAHPPEQWGIVEKLIADAPELRMTQRYVMVDHRPAFRSKSALAVPAIAIPTESGKTFECPKEQTDQLLECIPRVTRVLLVGWRAADRALLDLLARLQSSPLHILIVAGGYSQASEVIERISGAGVKAQCVAYDGGFSRFVMARAGDSFFRAEGGNLL